MDSFSKLDALSIKKTGEIGIASEESFGLLFKTTGGVSSKRSSMLLAGELRALLIPSVVPMWEYYDPGSSGLFSVFYSEGLVGAWSLLW